MTDVTLAVALLAVMFVCFMVAVMRRLATLNQQADQIAAAAVQLVDLVSDAAADMDRLERDSALIRLALDALVEQAERAEHRD